MNLSWCKRNPKKAAEAAARWRAKNPGKSAEGQRVWRAKNPDKAAENYRVWYAKNADKRLEYNREWRKKNPEKARKTWRVGNKIKRDHNPLFRLLANTRTRIRMALKNNSKTSHTCDLIGCTIPELRAHLEALFVPGMTWENQGQWHVDHIRPCASFDFSDPAQQRECFHFTNLQPLWAIDNLRKGDKILQP